MGMIHETKGTQTTVAETAAHLHTGPTCGRKRHIGRPWCILRLLRAKREGRGELTRKGRGKVNVALLRGENRKVKGGGGWAASKEVIISTWGEGWGESGGGVGRGFRDVCGSRLRPPFSGRRGDRDNLEVEQGERE